MDISVKMLDYEPGEIVIDDVAIPVIVAGRRGGLHTTAADLAARRRRNPTDCDHAGATWSSNLAMRCPRCGVPLFLPPHLLAHLSATMIAMMDELWTAAGWPPWSSRDNAWHILPDHWQIAGHPLYDYLGGLPVHRDRQQQFVDALASLELEVA